MSAQKASISMTEEMMESVQMIQDKTGQSRSGVIQMLISAGIEQVRPIFFGSKVEQKTIDALELLQEFMEKISNEE